MPYALPTPQTRASADEARGSGAVTSRAAIGELQRLQPLVNDRGILMDQAGIFSPFRKRSEGHEDRLSWGLMVLLKYVPPLQRYFRDLVLRHIPPDRWPAGDDWEPAAVATQVTHLGNDGSFVVSVLLSDESLVMPVTVGLSERRARYDGAVWYRDLTLHIENKPHRSDVRAEQLSPSARSFGDPADIEVYKEVVALEWAEVLEGIRAYATSPLASYAERTLAEDFLAFVEDVHPALNPYRTFKRCGTVQAALDKRIRRLLEMIGRALGYDVGTRPGGYPYLHLPTKAVRELHIKAHPSQASEQSPGLLEESIYPADTVGQAREFFQRVDRDAFLALESHGWEIQPNLHFSHVQKHIVWAQSSLGVAEYLDYFLANSDQIGRKNLNQVDLRDLAADWLRLGLISESDEAALLREFGGTQRSYLNVVPGLGLVRKWPMRTIIEMEAEQRLERELVEALRVPLATWGESIREWEVDQSGADAGEL